MLYKNAIPVVHLPNVGIDLFDIATGDLPGYIPALYLFIVDVDYELQMSIDLRNKHGFI